MTAPTQIGLSKYFGLTKTQRNRRMAMVKASRDHKSLIYILGNRCAICEATWADMPLQIDHVNGRENANHSAINRGRRWDVRVKAYWREFYNGVVLRVLCIECNSTDGRRRQLEAQQLPEAPF